MAEPVPQKPTLPPWREDPTATPLPGERPLWNRRAIYIVVALILIFGGATLGLLTWAAPVPHPVLVPLFISDYEAPQFAAPVLADPDRRALVGGDYFQLAHGMTGSGNQQRHQMVRDLTTLRQRQDSEAVVVYLSAYALRDARGAVQILPADGRPDEAATLMPLRLVLEALAECPAKNKLLILDLMRPVADPLLGLLRDDVAGAVPEELEAVRDGRRLVLCACAPGQVSLASEELGRSVFGYYLEQGLRGWADGYRADGFRDGAVSVRELAEFVEGRVDRWAVQNRQTRQTPVLYGAGPNFRLVALDHGKPSVPLTPLSDAKYAPWLLEGWKKHDQTRKDHAYRVVPRLVRQQEALLLLAERDWRSGRDQTLLQTRRRAELARVQEELNRWQRLPRPTASSLAQAAVAGETVDDEAKKAFEELQILLKQPTGATQGGHEKLLSDFRTKWLAKSPYSVARLVCNAVLEETNPTPEKLRPLDALLRGPQDTSPRYLETLVLRRLVELAGPDPAQAKPSGKPAPPAKGPPWPTEAVRLLLDVTARGEWSVSQAETFAWNADLLEQAAQMRHEGEVLFWARGYAALADAEKRLREAADLFRLISTRAELVQKAQDLLDEAMLTLPAYLPYLEADPDRTKAWTEAVRSTGTLRELLQPLEKGSLRKVEGLQDQTDVLRKQLAALQAPFSGDNIELLLKRGKQLDAEANVLVQINGVLATPWVKATDRAALYAVSRDLQRRLHQQTQEQDNEDDEKQKKTESQGSFDADKAAQEEDARGERRAATALTLLELMAHEAEGMTDERLRPARSALLELRRGKRDVAHWFALASALRRGWTKQLLERLEENDTPAAHAWLSWLAPPLDDVPPLDRQMPATVKQRLQQIAQLADWHADRLRYQARDYRLGKFDLALPTSLERFYEQAALNLRPTVAAQPFAQLSHGPLGVTRLRENNSPIQVPVRVELIGVPAAKSALTLQVFNPDRQWLKTKLQETPSQLPSVGGTPPTFAELLELALPPGADSLTRSPPLGLLLQAKWGTRTYHAKIDVPLTSQAEVVQLLLSSSSKKLVLANEVTLRPGKIRQVYTLYAHNQSGETRKVLVEIKAAGELLKGGSATLTLEPDQKEKIVLGDGAVLPKEDLPEFHGPLEIRVLDADTRAVLGQRVLSVDVALPRNYVRITEIQFRPASPTKLKNRLQVGLRSLWSAEGPEIPVELVLPPERIPGLIAVKDGTFKGTLQAKGDSEDPALELYAEALEFREVGDDNGMAYLNVDGYDRAFIFRTTFSRRGPTTTPKGDIKPAVRFRADQYLPASDKTKVLIEVDNPPDGAKLEFAVGRRYSGDFKPDLPPLQFADAKQKRLGFSLDGASKGLVFTAEVKDWLIPLDTTKLLGQRELRARLLSATGQELETIYQTVIVKDSPPEGVRFVEAPKKAKRGSTMPFKVLAQDREVGVTKVFFFVGQPQDNKPPKEAKLIPADPVDGRKMVWVARVPFPEDRKGPTEVSVQVINAVGLSTFETTSVELLETDPEKTGPGKISGKVLQGPLAQPDLLVVLTDVKGAEKNRTKTRKDGSFLFDNVAPGSYRVTAYKQEVQRRGSAVAVVLPNKETAVTVSLELR